MTADDQAVPDRSDTAAALAEAERVMRGHRALVSGDQLRAARDMVMAEFDRRGAALAERDAEIERLRAELAQADHFGRGEFRVTSWAYEQVLRNLAERDATVAALQADLAKERAAADLAHTTVDRLTATIARVRALHRLGSARDDNGQPIEVCLHDGLWWPCPTVAALSGSADTPSVPYDVSVVCGDSGGPNGVGGACVLPPGHPHVDGIGGAWFDDDVPAADTPTTEEPNNA